jgi:hypothetical protein
MANETKSREGIDNVSISEAFRHSLFDVRTFSENAFTATGGPGQTTAS